MNINTDQNNSVECSKVKVYEVKREADGDSLIIEDLWTIKDAIEASLEEDAWCFPGESRNTLESFINTLELKNIGEELSFGYYTIKIVEMTHAEYENLPEGDAW